MLSLDTEKVTEIEVLSGRGLQGWAGRTNTGALGFSWPGHGWGDRNGHHPAFQGRAPSWPLLYRLGMSF